MKNRTGFTMIELIVVVIILSIATLAVTPMLFRTLRFERLHSGCRKMASFISLLQSECVLNAKDLGLQYDVTNDSYRVLYEDNEEGDIKELPDGVVILDVSLSDYDTFSSGTVHVDFKKDGWITPHLIHIAIEDKSYEFTVYTLEVIPLTGQVRIHNELRDWKELML